MQRVLTVMKGREFHEAVASLPGYAVTDAGSVSTVKEFLESVTPRDAARKRNEGHAVGSRLRKEG